MQFSGQTLFFYSILLLLFNFIRNKMHIKLIAEPTEDPDSPEPEPGKHTHLDHKGTYFVVEFKAGSASISLLDERWIDSFSLINMSELQSVIEKTMGSGPHLVSLPDGPITVAIIASDDAHMCQLNGDYRDKPDPTNVLSFPDGTFEEIEGEFHLGDIFLGYEIIKSEAEKQDIPLRNHLLHLIVHGILHLLGYDHQEEHQAQIMEQKEVLLLSLFNIPDPYLL